MSNFVTNANYVQPIAIPFPWRVCTVLWYVDFTGPFYLPSSPDACYLARHVALKVGCPVKSPALTLNRLCGSGFETVIQVRDRTLNVLMYKAALSSLIE